MNLEINKIFNMDCLEYMKTLPDKCVDLIIADPPYNRNVATWDNIKEDRYIELLAELAKESKRILKDDGSIFIYNQQPMASLMFNIFYKELIYIDEIVWYCELLPPLTGKPVEVGASLFYPACNNRSCQTVYSMVGHTNHL